MGKALISLICNGEIQTAPQRRMKEEIFFVPVDQSSSDVKGYKDCNINNLIAAVDISVRLINPPDYNSFHRFTGFRFKRSVIVITLEQCNAGFTDLKILCRYLSAFFADDGPISFMDLGLNKKQIIDLLDSLYSGNFVLQDQGLIEINKERGGFYLNGVPTTRLIDLMRGKPVPVR